MRRVAFALLTALLLCASTAQATTYYVRTDGSNANTGTTNSSGGAWLTITKGCTTAAAGDVVRVQPGTYSETPSGCTSGSGINTTVTLVADGAVTTCGLSFSGKSYIRFIGFTFDPSVSGCSVGNHDVTGTGTNTGLEFWNDTIADCGSCDGYFFWTSGGGNCNQCIIFGGAVNNIGNPVGWNGITIDGSDNLIGYVSLSTICYIGIGQGGTRTRVLNANFSGMLQCGGTHPDFFFPEIARPGTGFNHSLVEAVFGIGTTNSTDNKFAHQSMTTAETWSDNVWRFNVSYNLGAAFYSVYDGGVGTDNRVRFYNNSVLNCQRDNFGSQYSNCGNFSLDGGGGSAYLYNELFYQAWDSGQTLNIQPWVESAGTFFRDYNLAFSPLGSDTFCCSWSSQSHAQTNVDPKLNNFSGLDFTLGSTSGARGVGTALTTATSCSGTTLNVATNTGSFFVGDDGSNLTQYGGKLDPGDFLTIDSNTYQVASVSGDAITLNTSLTCSSGDAVYFGKSSTIDMGAYPYKSTGYTLSATYSIAAGTATITPNDSTLVRYVVCYDSTVPIAVVNASPWTCSTGPGTFSAWVYPRYASQTQGVQASFSIGGGTRPLRNLIIRGSASAALLTVPLLWRARRDTFMYGDTHR